MEAQVFNQACSSKFQDI